MERTIARLARKKIKFLISEKFENKVILVDFYNIYCSVINFNKYKTFSRETYIICMNKILEKFKNNNIFVISKDIFEIERDYIRKIANENKNLTYILVDDLCNVKSINRERDDYACLLINNILENNLENTLLVTNDKMKNFLQIVKDVKPFKLTFYKKDEIKEVDIYQEIIRKNIPVLIKKGIPSLAQFKFEIS